MEGQRSVGEVSKTVVCCVLVYLLEVALLREGTLSEGR